jgi:hypothetical protein
VANAEEAELRILLLFAQRVQERVASLAKLIRRAEPKPELQPWEPSGRYFSAMPFRIVFVGLAIFFVGDLLV